ncbi:hypothetical protein ACFOFO_00185 [Undibacterium arcticum]|uniref:Uncharacterized protein n=2 Tax=Undibacterium arcticum TaxID=1762892 RepID=A0ABV7EYJ0_9BURK
MLDFDRSRCSDFVRETALPLLGKRPGTAMSLWRLSQAVFEWLEQFADDGPTICFDYPGDWDHLWDLLDRDMPAWLKRRNIRGNLGSDLFAQYFLVTGLEPHHALNDAQRIDSLSGKWDLHDPVPGF